MASGAGAALLWPIVCLLAVCSLCSAASPPSAAVTGQRVQSNIPQSACSWNGHPICCELLEEGKDSSVYRNPRPPSTQSVDALCTYSKVYHPSKYEQHHMAAAQHWQALPEEVKLDSLLNFIVEDAAHVAVWLSRVQVHMKASIPIPPTEEDFLYLSYYNITRSCYSGHNHAVSSWLEWIEPITVHARNPLSLVNCPSLSKHKAAFLQAASSTPQDLHKGDHVLLKMSEKTEDHIRGSTQHAPIIPRNFLFDTTTGPFQDGLQWFLCSYVKRQIVFDEIYAWDGSVVSPQDYSKTVPSRIGPHLHFNSAPASAGNTSLHSVGRMIREVAKDYDFVSVKLDLPDLLDEVSVAQEILHDSALRNLVDEFFFEFRFRCEVMMGCGWSYGIPAVADGFVLNRYNVMKFFHDLRVAGIRAHFWP